MRKQELAAVLQQQILEKERKERDAKAQDAEEDVRALG
jgi:hypothetical protein